jgi:hypothetical protein
MEPFLLSIRAFGEWFLVDKIYTAIYTAQKYERWNPEQRRPINTGLE